MATKTDKTSAQFVATNKNSSQLQSLKPGDFFYTSHSTRLHQCKKISKPCTCDLDFEESKSKVPTVAHFHIQAVYVMDGQPSYFNHYSEMELETGEVQLRHINQDRADYFIIVNKPIHVNIKHLTGAKWMVVWENCPNKDNVLISHINYKDDALKVAAKYGFTVLEHKKENLEKSKKASIPGQVNQDPFTHNSELSNQGLERLLPSAPSKKRGLSAVLTNKNVATNEEIIEVDELDSLDIPVNFIGQFGYNENGVLVEGEIVTVEIATNKIFAKAEIGQTSFGWALGTENRSKFTHDGSGGGCHGVFLDARYQFASQEEAKIASFYHLKRSLEYELKNAPEQAVKAYKKEIDYLNSLIDGKAEPNGFDILAKPEKVPKVPSPKKLTTISQPRTEMMKFRCSKEFKVLMHEMASLTNDSIADIIHKAVKCFPKTDMRLHTKIDYKRLDEII